jgi:predicted transcriptional regulator
VINEHGVLVGVLTRRDLLEAAARDEQPLTALIKRTLKFVYDDCTVRQAANHMVNHKVGRLPVVRRAEPRQVVGMITRSDVLSVFQRHVDESQPQRPTLRGLALGRGKRQAGG